MKRLLIFVVLFLFCRPADAQLFRRLFGGGRVQTVSCHQPTYQAYQPTYYAQNYATQYVPVAAVPLATVPVAVDLQAYIYSVNAGAFQSFREYQQAKVQNQEAPVQPVASSVPQQSESLVQRETKPIGLLSAEDQIQLIRQRADADGVQTLQKNCISCHREGNKPKSGFSIFDKSGKLAQNLPWNDILSRISAKDPTQRMPPNGNLSTSDMMAIVRYASDVQPAQETRMAAAPTQDKVLSPFD